MTTSKKIAVAGASALALCLGSAGLALAGQQADLLIKGGTVYDGGQGAGVTADASHTLLTGSANDGYAVPAWSSWNATDVRVNLGKGLSGETYNTALRWTSATSIPQGTNITSAYVWLRADNSQSTITTGKMAGGTFVATEVLAKHDSTYMPPQVAQAIARAKAAHRIPADASVPPPAGEGKSPDLAAHP